MLSKDKEIYYILHIIQVLTVKVFNFLAPTSEIDLSSPLNYGTPSSRTGGPLTPGAAATPIRSRPDVRSNRKIRQVTIGGSDPSVRIQ